MKPRILDLFCGAGGAAVGYHRAGFEVVGVDIATQPRYPFNFYRDDAVRLLGRMIRSSGWGVIELDQFDAIHASPPCQRYSTATKRNGTQDGHPDLIGPIRDLLEVTDLPYVIENVVGAPLIDPVLVCGTERSCEIDGYRLRRHRHFELGFPHDAFPGCRCDEAERPVLDVTGGGPTFAPRQDGGGGRPFKGTADQARAIMGMPWATKAELNEAIPPVYTELVGHQLMQHVQVRAVA